jgi:hypothetical protein
VAGERGAADWVALVLVCASAALAALLELMFLAKFYVGSVIIPVTIVAAVAGNIVLPRIGRYVFGTVRGAIAPIALWLLVILVPTLYNRPEGDLFVLGVYGQQYAYYGLLFGGAVAGFGTVIVLSNPKR